MKPKTAVLLSSGANSMLRKPQQANNDTDAACKHAITAVNAVAHLLRMLL